ncbi:hypothetical protein BV25DRAFT_1920824 [Artomyces pyxidatus]|uniref:Uncharacterized protein n=1 Tax=Artomyces pyxidatus TaxID=48021 RepID=A0ACB8SJS8_9AGAM|nr:hypothetical protein BV25DRAFT_1920824 [Artomyces pyxidatus]
MEQRNAPSSGCRSPSQGAADTLALRLLSRGTFQVSFVPEDMSGGALPFHFTVVNTPIRRRPAAYHPTTPRRPYQASDSPAYGDRTFAGAEDPPSVPPDNELDTPPSPRAGQSQHPTAGSPHASPAKTVAESVTEPESEPEAITVPDSEPPAPPHRDRSNELSPTYPTATLSAGVTQESPPLESPTPPPRPRGSKQPAVQPLSTPAFTGLNGEGQGARASSSSSTARKRSADTSNVEGHHGEPTAHRRRISLIPVPMFDPAQVAKLPPYRSPKGQRWSFLDEQ